MSKLAEDILEQLRRITTGDRTFQDGAFEAILQKLHHLTALEEEVERSRPLVLELQARVKDLEGRLGAKSFEAETSEKLVKKQQENETEVVRLLEDQRSRCTQLEARLVQKEQTISTLSLEKKGLSEDLQSLQKVNSELERRCMDTVLQTTDLQARLASLTSEVQAEKNTWTIREKQHTSAVRRLNENVERLKLENLSVKEKLSETSEELRELRARGGGAGSDATRLNQVTALVKTMGGEYDIALKAWAECRRKLEGDLEAQKVLHEEVQGRLVSQELRWLQERSRLVDQGLDLREENQKLKAQEPVLTTTAAGASSSAHPPPDIIDKLKKLAVLEVENESLTKQLMLARETIVGLEQETEEVEKVRFLSYL